MEKLPENLKAALCQNLERVLPVGGGSLPHENPGSGWQGLIFSVRMVVTPQGFVLQSSLSNKEEHIREMERRKEGKRNRIGEDEEGKEKTRFERWKLSANAKTNPKKMVLLPSTGDKGI